MMTALKDEIDSIEKNIGGFSQYQTTAGAGDSIAFDKKPAQQFLKALGSVSGVKDKLSIKENNAPMQPENNQDVIIQSFANSEETLTISGKRIDRLTKSTKIYINNDIVPKGIQKTALQNNTILPQDKSLCEEAKIHWQNLAVGICHVQEIDLLVSPIIIDGKAISAPRVGEIKEDAPAILLLSSPALNFSYGTAQSLSSKDRNKFIEGMYRNLFNAAISEGRNYIALPAAGLGAFGGEPDVYFKALMKVSAENQFKDLNIIYHPAQFGTQFDKALKTSKSKNVVRATKDVVFIADALTKQGKLCALHNPSDADVVYGIYDVGEYWKNGKTDKGGYVGEEHIGAMTTAPLNSFGFNPQAYNNVVEQKLTQSPISHVLDNFLFKRKYKESKNDGSNQQPKNVTDEATEEKLKLVKSKITTGSHLLTRDHLIGLSILGNPESSRISSKDLKSIEPQLDKNGKLKSIALVFNDENGGWFPRIIHSMLNPDTLILQESKIKRPGCVVYELNPDVVKKLQYSDITKKFANGYPHHLNQDHLENIHGLEKIISELHRSMDVNSLTFDTNSGDLKTVTITFPLYPNSRMGYPKDINEFQTSLIPTLENALGADFNRLVKKSGQTENGTGYVEFDAHELERGLSCGSNLRPN